MIAPSEPPIADVDENLLSAEDRALFDRLDAMVNQAVADNEKWEKLAVDAGDYINNNQWVRRKVKEGWNRTQVNVIYPKLEQSKALLMQRVPTIICEPWRDNDPASAAVWQDRLQWLFDKALNVPALRPALFDVAAQDGQAVVYVYRDEQADWLAGEQRWHAATRLSVLRRQDFGLDPLAKEGLKDAQYCFRLRTLSLAEAIALWPDREDELRASVDSRQKGEGRGTANVRRMYQGELRSAPVDDSASVWGESEWVSTGRVNSDAQGLLADILSGRITTADESLTDDRSDDRVETVTYLEIWFKDHATQKTSEKVKIPVEDLQAEGRVVRRADERGLEQNYLADTGELLGDHNHPSEEVKGEAPLYPYGRHVIRVGRLVKILDEAWTLPRWPFVIYRFGTLVGTWRGRNGVEMMRELQDAVNTSYAHLVNWIKNFCDSAWKVVPEALHGGTIDNIDQKLGSAAGQVLAVTSLANMQAVEKMAPPPAPAGLFEAIQMLSKPTDDIGGMQQVALGATTPGQHTLGEITMLQTNSHLRTALQAQLEDECYVSLMELVYVFEHRYADEAELMRTTSKEHAAAFQPQAPQMGPDGQPVQVTPPSPFDSDVRFDLSLKVGTAMPYDKQRRQLEAQDLLKLLGPTPTIVKHLLSTYDLPDDQRAAIEVEVGQAQAAQQALAQQEAASKGAPSGAGKKPEMAGALA